jgi:hypothetical protein
MFEAGGRRLLWAAVREELLRVASGRARSPEEVAALRAWVDLEHGPTFAHWLGKFEDARRPITYREGEQAWQ